MTNLENLNLAYRYLEMASSCLVENIERQPCNADGKFSVVAAKEKAVAGEVNSASAMLASLIVHCTDKHPQACIPDVQEVLADRGTVQCRECHAIIWEDEAMKHLALHAASKAGAV